MVSFVSCGHQSFRYALTIYVNADVNGRTVWTDSILGAENLEVITFQC